MTNGKSFAGNLKIVVTRQTWGAEAPMHLRGFHERRMQFGVIFLKGRDLHFQFQLACPIA